MSRQSVAAEPQSILRGTLADDDSSQPLADAEVSLTPRGADAPLGFQVTDRDGRFVFEKVPAGMYAVSITLLGYESFQDSLEVQPDTEIRFALRLSVSPIELEPIVVVTKRPRSGLMTDFDERRARLHGAFITHDEIVERKPGSISDMLATLPGVLFVYDGVAGYELRIARGAGLDRAEEGGFAPIKGCTPRIFIDGTPITTSTRLGLDEMVLPEIIETVEVYTNQADVPPQFGQSQCGVVAFRTLTGTGVAQSADSGLSLRHKLSILGALLALSWLIIPRG